MPKYGISIQTKRIRADLRSKTVHIAYDQRLCYSFGGVFELEFNIFRSCAKRFKSEI